MCDARCKRSARSRFVGLASKRSSGTCPAVLQRQSATENRVTVVTQSRACRSESSVSASPKPSGLTTPAPTTPTRAEAFSPAVLCNWITVDTKNWVTNFYCFLTGSILQVSRTGNGSLEVGGLSVEFIQWRFEI